MIIIKYEFLIEGEPVGKGRARITKYGSYTPKKTKEYQELVKWCYKGINFNKKPVKADIKAYFSHPKTARIDGERANKPKLIKLLEDNNLSTKGTKKELWLRICENNLIPPTDKPDGDNVIKSILDALNEIAFDDDSQVIDMRIRKYRSLKPRAEVILEEVKDWVNQ